MKKENTKEMIAKKKKQIKIACYVSLVILVILLFLPPFLRIFVVKKEEVVQHTVEILSCEKLDESLSSTFFDSEPQNIKYLIKGNHTVVQVVNPDEATENPNDQQDPNNPNSSAGTAAVDNDSSNLVDEPPNDQQVDGQVPNDDGSNNNVDNGTDANNEDTDESGKPKTYFELVRPYSTLEYDEKEDLTEVKTYVSDLKGLNEYSSIFSTFKGQQEYFEAQGFSCSRSTM